MTLFLDQIIQYFALAKEKLSEKFLLLVRWQVDLSIGVKNTSLLIVFVVNVLTIILFCFIFLTVNAACVMHGQSYCQVIFGVTFILSLFDIRKQSVHSVKFFTKHYCVRGFPEFIFILEDIIYLVCLG